MQNIYIINGAKKFVSSNAQLSQLLCDTAKQTLENLGKNVDMVKIDDGYEASKECEKIINSDCIIWQMPAWWMGEPWIVKKYIDEVFIEIMKQTGGNDGRSSNNPSKNYGTGGKLKGKKYMFSVSWNAPFEAFSDENEFFKGLGVEAVYMHLHKAMEFIGLSGFPTFICNDVVKNPQIEKFVSQYKEHLKKYFG